MKKQNFEHIEENEIYPDRICYNNYLVGEVLPKLREELNAVESTRNDLLNRIAGIEKEIHLNNRKIPNE